MVVTVLKLFLLIEFIILRKNIRMYTYIYVI
jgi:hypothetical protein